MLLIIISVLLLGACQLLPEANSIPTDEKVGVSSDEPSPADLHPEIWLAWEAGPHSAEYDLEKGPNTYCARCHSPLNWDPEAEIDPPPNCVSCKFPHENEVRIAAGNPLIPEDEWQGVSCQVCHAEGVGGETVVVAWQDEVTGYAEVVSNSSELCEKCHHDTETLSHQREISGIHSDLSCVECHNPHSGRASCGDVGCHAEQQAAFAVVIPAHVGVTEKETCVECHTEGMDEHTMYVKEQGSDDCLDCHIELTEFEQSGKILRAHSMYHQQVDCAACHDATGSKLIPDTETDQWVAVMEINFFGETNLEPFTPHNLQLNVDCERCHYIGNPWELPTKEH